MSEASEPCVVPADANDAGENTIPMTKTTPVPNSSKDADGPPPTSAPVDRRRLVIAKKYACIVFKNVAPTPFGLVAHPDDKYAVVLFVSNNRASASAQNMRSYLNAGTGRTRGEAFADADAVLQRIFPNRHGEDVGVRPKVYGIVSRLYDSGDRAMRHERLKDRRAVHEIR